MRASTERMRVLITGGGGQLATALDTALEARNHTAVSLPHAEWDVSDGAMTTRLIEQTGPDVIVNTAAYHRVDEVEDRPALAFRVNAEAVLDLARSSRLAGARLVHFSTDYVFTGESGRPLTEQDLTGPLNVYGVSKLAGEHLALQANPDALVLRTSG